jgi:prenyltransferase beta subunit
LKFYLQKRVLRSKKDIFTKEQENFNQVSHQPFLWPIFPDKFPVIFGIFFPYNFGREKIPENNNGREALRI